MHFDIDGLRYVVTIAPRPLFLDGQPRRAKLDRARQRIWLSDQLPRHERRRKLFHELSHAWVDARGRPAEDEGHARDCAEMIEEIYAQYLAQGGDDVLEALDPDATVKLPRTPTGALGTTSAPCGHCGALVAIGSISSGTPQWNHDTAAWMVDRGLLCELCDSVTLWREYCTAEGMPSGGIVAYPQPRVLQGAAAADWIRQHARECRIHPI